MVRSCRDERRERFETWRIDISSQAAQRRATGMIAVGGNGLERRHDAPHYVGGRGVPCFAENLGRELRQLAKRFAPRIEGAAQIRRFARKLRSLRLPEL